jgi:hypothetical protein
VKESPILFGEKATRRLVPLFVAVLVFALAACGGESTGGGAQKTAAGGTTAVEEEAGGTSGGTTAAQETTEQAGLTPAEATVGPREETSMMPADGKEPDPAQPPPEDPPEGVRTFPATTNRSVDGPIEYPRKPPTNGDHSPIWQNCGFYSEPVDDRTAVHSLDHGVVWITYRPDLPEEQVEALRPYGDEEYVIVSPYPGQPAPVIATAWRNQLRLDGPDDPRLRQFVDQFRVSETAPLSGNRCVGGVGDPE